MANSIEAVENLEDVGPSGDWDVFDEPTIVEGAEEPGSTDDKPLPTEQTEEKAPETTQEAAADEPEAETQEDEPETDEADPFAGMDEREVAEWKKLNVTNPKDPEQLAKIDVPKLLARIAQQVKFIDESKTKSQGTDEVPATAKVIDFTEGLSVKKPEGSPNGAPAQPGKTEAQPQPGSTQPAADTQAAKPRPVFNDGFDHWNDFPDAYKEQDEAYAAGDLDKAHKIEIGLLNRRFHVSEQALEQRFNAKLKAGIQEALGKFRDTELAEIRKPGQAAEKADQLAKRDLADQEWAGRVLSQPNSGIAIPLNDLLAIDPTPLIANGVQYENTLYNRTMLDPEVARVVNAINEKDDNEQVAYRKTIVARTMAVAHFAKLMQKPAVDPSKANELVEAGRRQAKADEQKKANEKTRQSLNGGRTSSASGSGAKSTADQMADDIVRPSDSVWDNFGVR